MNPGLITIILNVVFFAFLLFGFLGGLKGIKKATTNLISFIITTIAVIFLTVPISNLVLGIHIGELTIQETIAEAITSMFGESMAGNELVVALSDSIPVLLVSIIVCILLIIIVGIICKIITSIVYRLIFGKNKKEKVVEEVQIVNGTPQMTKKTIKEKKYRLLGGLVGAIQGLLIAIITFMPLFGLVNIVSDIAGVSQVQAEVLNYEDTHKYLVYPTNYTPNPQSSNDSGLKTSDQLLKELLPQEFYEYAKAIDESLFAKMGKIGNMSEATLNLVAKCDINGQTVKLGDELRIIVNVYDEFVAFADETTGVLGTNDINAIFTDMMENPDRYNFEELYTLCDNLFESNLIKALGNDALLLGCDLLIESNTDQAMAPIYSHIKTAVESYDACGYILKDDLKAVVSVFELSAKNGLIKEITAEEFDIHGLAKVLLNEPDANKTKNQNLTDLTSKIASSNLLQKIVLEATNYGATQLQTLMNENIPFNNDEQVNLPKINSTQNIKVSGTELSNLIKNAYLIYQEYEKLDIDKIMQDFFNIFDYDVKNIVTLIGEELHTVVNMSIMKDTGLFANICEAMDNSEIGEYVSFDELAHTTNINSHFVGIANALDDFKNSNILSNIKDFSVEYNYDKIDNVIDDLVTTNSENKTLATRLLQPLLDFPVLKNTLIYALSVANESIEGGLKNLTENPDLTISDFNTTNIMTQTGNQELLDIINNLATYLDNVKLNDIIGTQDNLLDTIIESDLPKLGTTFDCIKASTLFASNGSDNGVYKDLILALNQTDMATVFDFSVATDANFSWTTELTLLDESIDTLNSIKIGEDGLVTYMINNTDFDAIFNALKQEENISKVQSIKAIFDISLVKPLALTVVNSVNDMIKDFVGESLGANIVDIDNTVDLKSQSQQITNVLEKALDVDLEQTNIENIDKAKLDALLDAMEVNAQADGVFKQAYNAILLKVANMINESVADFVGEAGSNITRVTQGSDVISDSQKIRQVLSTAIDSINKINDIEFKNLNSADIFDLIDIFKTNSEIANGVFANTYNALLVYTLNIVNTEISNYVGSTFNTQIIIYNGSTYVTGKYNLIREVVEKGITAFSSIPEGKELKDIDSAILGDLLDALSYLDYTKPAYNALNNKLANTVIESINSLTGDNVATITVLKDLNLQADDIFTIVDISLKLVPVLENTGLKLANMTSEVKTSVAGFMNAMQLNSFRTDGVFKASYNSLIEKVASENGVTSTFIYENFAENGVIDWNSFLTSI